MRMLCVQCAQQLLRKLCKQMGINRTSSEGQWSPRAFERLNAAMLCRLTLLVGPAGCGKTSVLRAWSNARAWPVAWVTLTPEDNSPARFMTDLAAALQTLGLPMIERPALSQSGLTDALVEFLNTISEWPDDFGLALDSYEHIDSPAVHDAVGFILDYLPPHMHLMIASRTEPPLPLPRLRVRRQLVELGPEDFARGCSH